MIIEHPEKNLLHTIEAKCINLDTKLILDKPIIEKLPDENGFLCVKITFES